MTDGRPAFLVAPSQLPPPGIKRRLRKRFAPAKGSDGNAGPPPTLDHSSPKPLLGRIPRPPFACPRHAIALRCENEIHPEPMLPSLGRCGLSVTVRRTDTRKLPGRVHPLK